MYHDLYIFPDKGMALITFILSIENQFLTVIIIWPNMSSVESHSEVQ